jgi:cobalamin biosynthesis protein CobW
VIVETSGVALPYDTQLHFWREPASSWVAECLGVVVVNAEQLYEARDLEGTFEDQVTSADLLVLNKLDLVPQVAFDLVEDRLRALEPEAPLVRAEHGQLEPAILFPEPGVRREAPRDPQPQPHAHESFESAELAIPDGAEPETLQSELAALGALRVKGFVRTRDGLRLVQGVGPRIDLEPVEVDPPGDLVGRLVVIRRGAE